MKIKNIPLMVAAVLAILIILVIVSVKEAEVNRVISIETTNNKWKQQFPNAVNNSYLFCNELGFLSKAYKYNYSISINLVTADNKVPIRCKTNYHQTIENVGKTSTSTVF